MSKFIYDWEKHKEERRRYILESDSHSNVEKLILIGIDQARCEGRITTTLRNKVARCFSQFRPRKGNLSIHPTDKTYEDFRASVTEGKYDKELLDVSGFGVIALRQLKDNFAQEIEMIGAQYYGMNI